MDYKNIIKMRYNETAKVFESRYRVIQNTKYKSIVENILIENGNIILDVGCGTGFFFDFFKEVECIKYGIDISIESLKIYRKKIGKAYPTNIICADADFPPLREGHCDIVFAITIFQNLPDPKRTLKELKKICRPNGLIILSLLKKKFQIRGINALLEDAQLTSKQVINDEKCEDIILIIENK